MKERLEEYLENHSISKEHVDSICSLVLQENENNGWLSKPGDQVCLVWNRSSDQKAIKISRIVGIDNVMGIDGVAELKYVAEDGKHYDLAEPVGDAAYLLYKRYQDCIISSIQRQLVGIDKNLAAKEKKRKDIYSGKHELSTDEIIDFFTDYKKLEFQRDQIAEKLSLIQFQTERDKK